MLLYVRKKYFFLLYFYFKFFNKRINYYISITFLKTVLKPSQTKIYFGKAYLEKNSLEILQ